MAEIDTNKVVSIAGLQAKHTYDEATYLKKSGDTISGTLILTNANDASPTSYDTTKPPALVVGGATTTAHLEIDTNEILAKANETTPSNLFLNDDVAGTSTSKVDVKVGISGAIDIYNTGIEPRSASNKNIGSTALPFNHMYGVNYNLYNKHDGADTDYGALRVGELDDKTPAAILELGDKEKDISGKITVHSVNAFTNIFANSENGRSTSNAVTLPQSTGNMLVYRASTTDIGTGATLAADTLYLVYE